MKTKLILFISLFGIMSFLPASAQLYEELGSQENLFGQDASSVSDPFLSESTVSFSSFQEEEGSFYKAARPDVGKNEGGSGSVPIGGGIMIILLSGLFYVFCLTRRTHRTKL